MPRTATKATRPQRRERLSVLVAPSGFKESLDINQTIAAIIRGGRRALPDADFPSIPMVDGGEGFTDALVDATGGTKIPITVTGPVGQRVDAALGFLGGQGPRVAVVEMAAAAGLRLVPSDLRNPSVTTSYGVGELIKAALDAGAAEIIVGCGDSGINDGGAGMAQALGVRLLDEQGRELGRGGGELVRLARIDLDQRDPRLAATPIEAAVNWYNVLTGPRGVARVFGPQKGASPEMVVALEAALERYASVVEQATGMDMRAAPGGGASGGLGTGLAALLGATLRPRYQVVLRYLDVEAKLEEADLVITAEGRIDDQTPRGKAPAEVARRAAKRGIPCICLAGSIDPLADAVLDHGITAFFSIAEGPAPLESCLDDADRLLERAAEHALRAVATGLLIASRPSAPGAPVSAVTGAKRTLQPA